MFDPLKIAFAEDLAAFHLQVVGMTRAVASFRARPFAKAYAWAPSRMVDDAQALVDAYQRNDTDQAPTQPPRLPMCLVAIAKNFEPMGHDFGIQSSEPIDLMIPDDPKERSFKVRIMAGDVRAQLAFFATDIATAQSIAAQYLLYIDPPARRRLWARYPFAGFAHTYPVQIETPDAPAVAVETNSRAIHCLAIDLTLKTTIPLFMAPGPEEPHDGKGTPGDPDDPAGYPVVTEVDCAWTEVDPTPPVSSEPHA